MSKYSLTALFFLAISPLIIVGQNTSLESPICNVEVARLLVDQQVTESRNVEDTDKRIQILIRSADFAWKFDQPTARDFFTEAFKVATDRYHEKGLEKKQENGLTTLLSDYRFAVIRAIAKRDSAWARRLIEQLLKEYEKDATDRNEADRGRELSEILNIAVASVKTNPDLSWYLFRRAMRERADYFWQWTLYSVASQDRAFGNALYTELIANYANETPRRMLFLSAYPFGNPRIVGVDKYQTASQVPEGFVPDEGLQIRFLTTFLDRALSYANDPTNLNAAPDQNRQPEPVYLISALGDLQPVVVQTFPMLLPRLSEATARAIGMLSDDMRQGMADREKWKGSQSATFDDRLAELEKADKEGKLTDSMILNLLISRSNTDEQFKKLESWLDKVRDQTARQEMRNYFWFLRSKLAIKESRLDDAEKFAAKVPELEHRAILLFEVIEQRLKNMNDRSSALQAIDDVDRVVRKSEDSVAKARVLLGLAAIYEKVNHISAMDELAEAVNVTNHVAKGDMLSSTIMRQIRTEGLVAFASFSMPGYDLENTFDQISKNDFEMSLTNAKALDDKFYRTIAVLAIAKNCVDKPKLKLATR
ncbi:MAG: hypothetical protein ACRD43_09500 [Pyrinomonadaceae bacterium]